MSEGEFWGQLQFRVNQASATAGLGWCDWFQPKRYQFHKIDSTIHGVVGFVDGRDCNKREFVVHIRGRQPRDLGEIDWDAMLPQVDVGDWCWWEDETLHIDAAAC